MVYVDLPTIDGSWKNVATFSTKAEAVAWIRAHVGHCDDDGNVSLVTELDDQELPERTS